MKKLYKILCNGNRNATRRNVGLGPLLLQQLPLLAKLLGLVDVFAQIKVKGVLDSLYVGWQVHVFHVHIDSALQPTVAANTVLVWHEFFVRAVNVGVLN